MGADRRARAPGKDYGIVWLPQVNDEVLVGFEHGDVRFPYVLGGLWNGVDTMPFDYGARASTPATSTFAGSSRAPGHKITFRESRADDSSIQLRPRAARSRSRSTS